MASQFALACHDYSKSVRRQYRVLAVWITLCVGLLPTSHCQVLSSTPPTSQPLCPREMVEFTCETRGSQVIIWRSSLYIGSDQLQFSRSNMEGSTQQSSDTVATLTRNIEENGVRVLVSTLRITIRSDGSSSVSCAHENGSIKIDTFSVHSEPGMLQPRNVEQRMHPFKEGVCTLFLSWDPMQGVTDYMVFFNGNHIGNTSNTSYALLVYCDSHTVRLRAINRCGQMSPNAPDAPVLPESFLYSDITTEQESDGGESSEPPAVAAWVPGFLGAVIVILIIFIVIILILFLRFIKKYRNKPVTGQESQTWKMRESAMEEQTKT